MSESKTVLCIDDSRVSRMKFRQLLLQKYPDWRIEEAGSGEEGLEKAKIVAPDLASIDINMPGMGGFVAAEQLRDACPLAKIVILSGNIQDSSRRRAEELGIGFIEKPITEASITQLLAFLEH